jgi:hypothetical protein
MWFLLRMTFWLAVVLVLLPTSGSQTAPKSQVSAGEAFSAAGGAATIDRSAARLCRQGVGALIGKLAWGVPIKFFSPVALVDWSERPPLAIGEGVVTARAAIVTASTAVRLRARLDLGCFWLARKESRFARTRHVLEQRSLDSRRIFLGTAGGARSAQDLVGAFKRCRLVCRRSCPSNLLGHRRRSVAEWRARRRCGHRAARP